jgi:osmoprotectant transport system permease protein
VSFLNDVFVWFNDPLNWHGPKGIPSRVLEHLVLSLAALLIASAIAVPGGALLGRSRYRGATLINLANIGRAIPSFAVIVVGVIWIGLGDTPVLIALVMLALPPIFVFSFTAVRQVDPATIESARGMGMTEPRLLRKVQLPVARPLIINGMRLSSAAVIATATLSALVGGGGLGRYVVDGFSVRDYRVVFAGTLLIVGLVVLSELFFAALARFTVSPGLRATSRRPGARRRAAPTADTRHPEQLAPSPT